MTSVGLIFSCGMLSSIQSLERFGARGLGLGLQGSAFRSRLACSCLQSGTDGLLVVWTWVADSEDFVWLSLGLNFPQVQPAHATNTGGKIRSFW